MMIRTVRTSTLLLEDQHTYNNDGNNNSKDQHAVAGRWFVSFLCAYTWSNSWVTGGRFCDFPIALVHEQESEETIQKIKQFTCSCFCTSHFQVINKRRFLRQSTNSGFHDQLTRSQSTHQISLTRSFRCPTRIACAWWRHNTTTLHFCHKRIHPLERMKRIFFCIYIIYIFTWMGARN